MQLFKEHRSSTEITVSNPTTKKTLQTSLNYMWQEQTIMPIELKKKSPKEAEDSHAMAGVK